VITTYEGKHNHEQPSPKKPNEKLCAEDEYEDDDGREELATAASNPFWNFRLSGSTNFPSTPHPPQPLTLQLSRNDTNPGLAYTRSLCPNRFGSFNNNMNIGSSSYTPQIHYSSFLNNANTIPYRFYGLDLNPYPTRQPQFPVAPPFNISSASEVFSRARVNANGSSSDFPLRGAMYRR